MNICYFTGEHSVDYIAVETSKKTHYDVWIEEDHWGPIVVGTFSVHITDEDLQKLRRFEAVEVPSGKGLVKIWRRDISGNRYDSDPFRKDL